LKSKLNFGLFGKRKGEKGEKENRKKEKENRKRGGLILLTRRTFKSYN
jgi:hypothetical protein